jgi:class 3 adenylate cyclase
MEAITSYLPASILSYLLDHSEGPFNPPLRQTYRTCVLFADVSGFTALCEAMAAKGPSGDEYLAKHLNSYFELLLRTMSSQGGDVFKFAGDAILVLWPPSLGDLKTTARRATQCAFEIKEKLQKVNVGDNIVLSVKVGVGVGEVNILHCGGVFGRMEYIATGQPLVQAFAAEHHAKLGDVVLAPEVWELVKDYSTAEVSESGAILLDIKEKIRKVNIFRTTPQLSQIPSAEVIRNVSKYVPSAVLPFIPHHEEKWAGELRRITVLFVNLSLQDIGIGVDKHISDQDVSFIQQVLESVQLAVYRYEGSLNKFLMDDKGSTLIAVFGLPPLAHEDDGVRGVLSSLAICAKLHELNLRPSIGVSTGNAFCGVVGNRRREYTVLGDFVNLAARLMQHATKQGGGIVCDSSTQYSGRHRLHFEDHGKIQVKGKVKPVSIWQPYPKSLTPLFSKPKVPVEVSTSSSGRRGSITGLVAGMQKANEKSKSSGFHSIRSIFDPFKSTVNQKSPSSARSHEDSLSMPTFHEENSTNNPPAGSFSYTSPIKPHSTGLETGDTSIPPSTPLPTSSEQGRSESAPNTTDSSPSSIDPSSSTPASYTGPLIRQSTATNIHNPQEFQRMQSSFQTSSPSVISSHFGVSTGSSSSSKSAKNLMAEIHSFQMQGYARKHFESFKRKQQKLAVKAGSSSSSGAKKSLLRQSQLTQAQVQALNAPRLPVSGGDAEANAASAEEMLASRHSLALVGQEGKNVEDYSELSDKEVLRNSATLSKSMAKLIQQQFQQSNNQRARRYSLDIPGATLQGLSVNTQSRRVSTGKGSVNSGSESSETGETDTQKVNLTIAIDSSGAVPPGGFSTRNSLTRTDSTSASGTGTPVILSAAGSRRPSISVAANRVKSVRIHLPDAGQNTFSVPTPFLQSVLQLKHEIWSVGQSQHIWNAEINENDFYLCYYDEVSPLLNPITQEIANIHLSKRISDELSFEEFEDFIVNQIALNPTGS